MRRHLSADLLDDGREMLDGVVGAMELEEAARGGDVGDVTADLGLALGGDGDGGTIASEGRDAFGQFDEVDALAAAEIDGGGGAERVEGLAENVDEVADPEEVEDLGVAEDGQRLAAKSLLREERNDAIAVAGAVDVGEAEDEDFEVGIAEEAAIHFAGGFADAVGVFGGDGRGLRNGERRGLAVDFARGGEDDAANAGGRGGAEDFVGADDVGFEGVVDVADGAEDVRLRR